MKNLNVKKTPNVKFYFRIKSLEVFFALFFLGM